MHRILMSTVLALAALAYSTPAARAAELDADYLTDVIHSAMAEWQVPGMAVAVVDKGEVVLEQGFGLSGPDGSAVDTHTLFGNASTTKAMVVAGLLMLADEGRLDLDDPVIDYLPELHFASEALTQQLRIRDLLAHRTGLPSTDFWTFRNLMPLAEQIRRLRFIEPEAPPRTRLIYQNTMYELAGLIIERVSGKPWHVFLKERLWQPIGMHETFGTRGQIPKRLTHIVPHAIIAGEVRDIPYDLPADREDAAGSVWSSIHDMRLWAEFLLRNGVTESGHRLISERGIDDMFEPQQLASVDDFYPTAELTQPDWRSYALGWFQQNFEGRKIDYHTGSLDGFIAIIGLDRKARRAVVVMANLNGAELRHSLLWEVMDNDTGATRRDWNNDVYELYAERARERDAEWAAVERARLKGTHPSLPLEAYAGTYRSEAWGDVEVQLHNDQLVLHTGMYDYDASHWHLDTFLIDYLTWSHGDFVTFNVDPEGAVESLEVFNMTFKRNHN